MADDETTAPSPEGETRDEQPVEASAEQPAESAEHVPAGEGHAVPTADAEEIAGSIEDAPLEALEQGEDKAAIEAAVEEDEEEEPAPREKPAVPGAHLEVDIVPEGVDPLGRSSSSGD